MEDVGERRHQDQEVSGLQGSGAPIGKPQVMFVWSSQTKEAHLYLGRVILQIPFNRLSKISMYTTKTKGKV